MVLFRQKRSSGSSNRDESTCASAYVQCWIDTSVRSRRVTEPEALEVIRREVEDAVGFVAQVERTGIIPAERVTVFLEALDTLAVIWKERSEVPKRGLLPLVDVTPRIYAAALTHENAHDQIEELGVEIYSHLTHVFGDPPDPHTEEGARRIIEERFSSTAGLPFTLRMRLGYSPALVDEALTALQTLQQARRDRHTAPPTPPGAMSAIPHPVKRTSGQ